MSEAKKTKRAYNLFEESALPTIIINGVPLTDEETNVAWRKAFGRLGRYDQFVARTPGLLTASALDPTSTLPAGRERSVGTAMAPRDQT